MKPIKKTSEVFGVSNEEIASYIERTEVDDEFQKGLTQNKHIIIFGSSKQGKTAVTNKHLHEKDLVRIKCVPESKPIDIYKSLLRQLNIEFEEEKTSQTSIGFGGKGGIKAKVKIPFLAEAEVSGEASGTKSTTKTTKTKTIEYNLELPQDISEILRKINFKKRIVLENFHYLEEETQRDLAFHLRIFEDYNILFVILGIWREKNRLAQYNGDLQDRLIEIPVEPWKHEDFKRVILEGEPLLNVSFEEITDQIITESFDSIGVFQELCKETCIAAGVNETKDATIIIQPEHLKIAVQKKLEDYSGRHIRSIESFIEQKAKSSDKTPLYLAFYFISIILTEQFDDIVAGMKRKQIQEKIQLAHHRPTDVRPSDMSNFLHNIKEGQIKKAIVPPIFDYDMSIRTLKIIDSTFYFFLRNYNCKELLDELDKPEGIK
ncbi:MAG: hypothetical protein RSD71_15265 [Flavobacterium sp.]|uniref:hypothetical protein n=1 Tax=Flavobacterium sp. TaxID=239 RepID=UPI002FC7D87D